MRDPIWSGWRIGHPYVLLYNDDGSVALDQNGEEMYGGGKDRLMGHWSAPGWTSTCEIIEESLRANCGFGVDDVRDDGSPTPAIKGDALTSFGHLLRLTMDRCREDWEEMKPSE